MQIVRTFSSEMVYTRTPLPMGKVGLTLKNGQLTPNGTELQQIIASSGAVAQPGDLVRISNVIFKDDYIRFEINGGPAKDQKWYQKITISGQGGATLPTSRKDTAAPSKGSYVDLYFDNYVPEITGPQLKELLRPVFNFEAKSAAEAYIETVPPKVKEAIKDHRVLVGMNREMVIYAKGLPPKKLHDKDGEIEYEEWIYGEPPQDMEFVRLVGDEVVRVETLKVSGEKTIRTEKEIDIEKIPDKETNKE